MMSDMKKKEITDKDVLDFLHSINPEKNIDLELLSWYFRSKDGIIYFDVEKIRAVGLYPHKTGLLIFFYDILPDNKVKYIDYRGISINEESEEAIRKSIESCKIKQKIKNDEDAFYYG